MGDALKSKIRAVLLAGGKGTRLWPLSTARFSKAYVNIGNNRAMISRSIERAARLAGEENIYIVVDKDQKGKLKEFTSAAINKNIITEPFGRSTASAIGLAAIEIPPEDIMLVLPTDSFIRNDKEFYKTVKEGIAFARKNNDALMCVGIVPDRPSSAYGYIKIKNNISGSVFSVDKFTEKPSPTKAARFAKNRRYLWNAGIFIFRAGAILSAMRTYSPELFSALQNIRKNRRKITGIYEKMKSVSIDYQIMEKAKDLYCVKGQFAWRDLGNWDNVGKLLKKDKYGNNIFGKAILLDTTNSVIYNSERKAMGVNGLDSVVVINTKNGILISARKNVENVKQVALASEMRNEDSVS